MAPETEGVRGCDPEPSVPRPLSVEIRRIAHPPHQWNHAHMEFRIVLITAYFSLCPLSKQNNTFFLWTQATKTVLTKTKSDLGSKNAKVFFFLGGGFTWIFKGWFFNKQHLLWFETNSLEQMVGELAVRLYLIIFFYTHTDSQRVTVSTYYKGPLFTTSCIQMTYMSWFQMDLDTSGSLLAARQARSCIMYINPSSPDKRTNNDGRKTTSQIPCCRFRESIIL